MIAILCCCLCELHVAKVAKGAAPVKGAALAPGNPESSSGRKWPIFRGESGLKAKRPMPLAPPLEVQSAEGDGDLLGATQLE